MSRSNNMDKANTSKDTMGKTEERLVWKKNGMRDFFM